MQNFIEKILPDIGIWGYWLVFLLTFLEASAFVGLLVPGEVTLLIAGLLASQGVFNLYILIVLAAAAAILGDTAGYTIGKYGGLRFLRRYGRYFFIKEHHLELARRYFKKHGGKTILLGRFVGILRSLAPVMAGISNMPYHLFAIYNVIGGIVSVTALLLLGYFFGESWELIDKVLGWGGVVAFMMVLTVAAAWLLIRRHKRSC